MDTETGMDHSTEDIPMEDIRRRLAGLRMTQEEFARAVGVADSTLSRVLRGRRSPAPGFVERVLTLLDRMERAERAAEEARARVLAEGE